MDGHEFEFSEVWDEYQWERFLKKQDQSTEKYFDLLERFMDHPDRDRLIAMEMGWRLSFPDDDDVISATAPSLEEEFAEIEEDILDEVDEFVQSPIYQDTLKLHRHIRAWMERCPEMHEEPEAIRLATLSVVCSAKLAAALCGDDDVELGMAIAYLKRGLKAVNDALEASARLTEDGKLTLRRYQTLNQRLFRIRNRIVDLMNEYRNEWRKRYGQSN